MQGGDAAARLLVAGARHQYGPVHLAFEDLSIARHAVADCLKLKTDSGEALRQRIVNLVRQTFALVGDRAQTPMLRQEIYVIEGEDQTESHETRQNQGRRAPPGRAGHYLDIFGRPHENRERIGILVESCVHDGNAPHPKPALRARDPADVSGCGPWAEWLETTELLRRDAS